MVGGFFLSNPVYYISFSCFAELAKPSGWIEMGILDTMVLFMILKGMTSINCHHVGFHCKYLLFRKVKIFFKKSGMNIKFCQTYFLHLWLLHDFSAFTLLMWYKEYSFYNIKQSLNSWDKQSQNHERVSKFKKWNNLFWKINVANRKNKGRNIFKIYNTGKIQVDCINNKTRTFSTFICSFIHSTIIYSALTMHQELFQALGIHQ